MQTETVHAERVSDTTGPTQEVTPEAPPLPPESDLETPPSPAPPPQVSRETEDKARDMGWVPQSEWRGSPDTWRPADQFVKRGEEVLPIVKSRADRAERKVHELESTVRDLPAKIKAEVEQSYADRFKRMEAMNRIALEKQREQIWHNFEEKKRSAVADGNMQAYDKLNQDQRQALSEFQPEAEFDERTRAEPAKPPPQTQVQAPREVQDWVADNTWFNSDPVLTAFATKEHGRLLKAMPGISIEDNLRRTLDATKQKFPEEFGISPAQMNGQREPHAPQVEGGGRQAQGTGKTRGWNDLPPEAKTSGDKFIRDDGLFLPKGLDTEAATETDIKKARDAYAKDYWSLS